MHRRKKESLNEPAASHAVYRCWYLSLSLSLLQRGEAKAKTLSWDERQK